MRLEAAAEADPLTAVVETASPDEERLPLRDLFRQIADGRAAALAALYDAIAPRLYGLAAWRLGDREDARDVVQDVFVRLASRRGELAAVRDPLRWLLTVTHRLAVDRARRRGVRATLALDEIAEPVAPQAEDASELRRVLAHLPALPPAQREAVYLRHVAGLTFAEMARVTGVPTFTAASRHRLAIAKLRRLMEVDS